jgi:hypothetical protein
MMNAGVKAVEWLFREQLKVDAEWSTRTPTGFRWWADGNAQSVEVVGQEIDLDGEPGYLVSVRTELLRSLALSDQALEGINVLLMSLATMAGPVYDQQTKTLGLASLVRVSDDNSQWMNPLISVAAALQVCEARTLGPALATVLGAEQALSGPPGRGARPEPDEIAEIAGTLFAPVGKQPSRWRPAEFQETVERFMRQPPALLANSGGAGFTVEFPYGDQSSLCQAMADQPHPRLGNGLFLLQSFPVDGKSDLEGARLALSLNRSELAERPFGYGFGSYAYRKNTLHFTSFVPNAAYRPGLLPNIYFSCALRAREMSRRLAGADWTDASYSPRRSAFGQLMDRLRGR